MAVKIWMLLICGIFILNLPAQSIQLQGKVVDQDGQPLFLALVYNSELSVGTYTDEVGFFQLTTDQSIPELEVFGLGFLRKNISLEGRTDFLNIQLEKLSYELDEIVVSPCQKSELMLGMVSGQPLSTSLGAKSGFSYQSGKSFPTSNGQQITAVEIHAINNNIRPAFFRLRIYELDSDGIPANDLLLENVLVRVPRFRQRRAVRVDLNEYNLRSPETGVLVAMEWLPEEKNILRITSRDTMGNRVEHEQSVLSLGLDRTIKDPNFVGFDRLKEREWSKSNYPIWGSKNENEVLLPAIRIKVRECK